MAHPTSIHHINFIVKDLEHSAAHYRRLLGLGPFHFDDLPERGARTARINLNGTWLVLVCPSRHDSFPGRFLAERGEGFFLLSFGIEDLDTALKYYEENGMVAAGATPRNGLLDWRVMDLKTEDVLGEVFHLTETSKTPE